MIVLENKSNLLNVQFKGRIKQIKTKQHLYPFGSLLMWFSIQVDVVFGLLRWIVHFNFRQSTSTSPKTTWIWSLTTHPWSLCCLASMTRKPWWGCSTAPMRWPTVSGRKKWGSWSGKWWHFQHIIHPWVNFSKLIWNVEYGDCAFCVETLSGQVSGWVQCYYTKYMLL